MNRSTLIPFVLLLFLSTVSFAQIKPVSLDARIDHSSTIAIVEVKEKISYWDVNQYNIYTLNILEVKAYLKGHSEQTEIAMITDGGIVGTDMQKTWPETNLVKGQRYTVFLVDDNNKVDHKGFRASKPDLKQCHAVARVQGALLYQNGKYIDALVEAPMDEESLLSRVSRKINLAARVPSGSNYSPKKQNENENTSRDAFTITNVEDGSGTAAPGPFISGTVVANNELIIQASGGGFGSTRGSGMVEFAYADDGGATFIAIGIDSDYVSWSDTEIRVKIPSDAGTGSIRVTDDAGDSDTYSSITIDYAINNIISSDLNWGADNRNRYELVDDNGSGGYTFAYSSAQNDMTSNTDARDAFERALSTWRCDSGVNFDISTSNTTADIANDGVNAVVYRSIGSGALGVASSRFSGTGIPGSCDMSNTYFYLTEVDIQFNSGTNWYYGSGSCSGIQYDFESVALHELGHAHGLGHVIDNSKVMHHAISNCVILTSLSSAESAAGAFKMGHSNSCGIGPSSMTAVPAGSCSLLPVSLTYFNGHLKGESVELHWQTAAELNNDYFLIERSFDGRNFEELGTVQGRGTTTEIQNYNLLDTKPRVGTNYYRLTQFDFDGAYEVFQEIVAVDYKGDEQLTLRPNPVRAGELQLTYQSNQSAPITVTIYSTVGQRLDVQEFASSGDFNQLEIGVNDLTPGVYLLQVQQGNESLSKRFVKSN